MNKYTGYFNQWSRWCEKFTEVQNLPAKEIHVALFLVSLIQTNTTYDVIESHVYAIKWYHRIASFKDPCNVLCNNILEAAKRTCSRSVTKKQPLSVENIRRIFEVIGGNNCSLLDLRNFTIILLGFAGFMRYSEIADLKISDIFLYPTFMKIFIEQSKTDVYREGHFVFTARVDSPICPVNILNLYVERSNIDRNSSEFPFRAVSFCKSKNSYHLRKINKPICYTTARTHVLKLIEIIGLDPTKFGLHSLRSGGATAAARNNIRDRLFKRHGRWKSERVKDGYVKDDINSLLSVTLNLGL